jgi:hypothetical protein
MHETSIPSAIPFRTHPKLSGGVLAVLGVLALIGVGAALLALMGDEPARFWTSLLVNWLFWSALAMGMVMFAVALHLTGASWAWSIRRFALAGVAFLPVSFILLIVVFFGSEVYFHDWLDVVRGERHDAVVEAKAAWLHLPSLIIRNLVGVLVLYALAIAFAVYSLRTDVYGVGAEAGTSRLRVDDPQLARHGGRAGAVARAAEPPRGHPRARLRLPLRHGCRGPGHDARAALVQHHVPVTFIVTGFHGGIAATAIAVAVLAGRTGLGGFVNPRQLHDLGKLLFGFSVFWMYINWSQYVVIWYGLLPEEQKWMVHRFVEPYSTLVFVAVVCAFVLPFVGLLTRAPKKVVTVLAFFGVLILIGHWVERFLLIYPSLWMGGDGARAGHHRDRHGARLRRCLRPVLPLVRIHLPHASLPGHARRPRDARSGDRASGGAHADRLTVAGSNSVERGRR